MESILSQLGKRASRMLADGGHFDAANERLRELDGLADSVALELLASQGPHSALNRLLTLWSEADKRPLVLLIDEIDATPIWPLVKRLLDLRSEADQGWL